MYLRTTRRKNKNGSSAEYYQLAHNERHPVTGKPVAKIIHNFGRTDELDRDSLVRLCRSIARVCGLTVVDELDPHQMPPETLGFPAQLKIKQTYPNFANSKRKVPSSKHLNQFMGTTHFVMCIRRPKDEAESPSR
jgi:hypothetical protein